MIKRMNLGHKLLLAFLTVGLIPFATISVVFLNKSSNELSIQAFAKLTAVRNLKIKQVQSHLEGIADQLNAFSSSFVTRDALMELAEGFNNYLPEDKLTDDQKRQMREKLGAFYEHDYAETYRKRNNGNKPDVASLLQGLSMLTIAIQRDYIASNENPIGEKHLFDISPLNVYSNYGSSHGSYHPAFRDQMMRQGFQDIFLLDAKTGDVIYSAAKCPAFGTSLIDGPYAHTGLSKAFHLALKATKPDEVFFVDYAPFAPSFDDPAAFMASPVFEDEKIAGVAVYQLSIDFLNEIMSIRAGMGKTGETYLVGPDHIMRSDAHQDPERHNALFAFKNPNESKVETQAVTMALDGKNGESIIANYNGTIVLSSYAPLDIMGANWALAAEIEKREALSAVTQLRWFITIFAIAGTVAVIAIAFMITRGIVKPVQRVVDGLSELAQGEGDLTMRLDVNSRDEIGTLSRRFNDFMEKLQSMIQNISAGIGTLSSSSKELSALATRMTATVEKTVAQSDSVESSTKEMNRHMESVSTAMERSWAKASMVASSAEEMSTTIQDIVNNTTQASSISHKTVSQTKVVSEKMAALVEAAHAIDKVTETITEISDQTNLLALNATIEASRAGEFGKGFAVVANEIKELARQTVSATQDIKVKVDDVQATTSSSMEEIEIISDFIKQVNDTVTAITTTVKEQSVATEEIAENIAQVSKGISEVNATIAKSVETTGTITGDIGKVHQTAGDIATGSSALEQNAQELSRLASKLDELVGRFKT